MNLIKYLGGFISEKNGKASSKRIGAFFILYLIAMQVFNSFVGIEINIQVFQTLVGLYAVSNGLVASEKFTLQKTEKNTTEKTDKPLI